jgi:hypothetical protein
VEIDPNACVSDFSDVVALANDTQEAFRLLDHPMDERAHAVATFMALDQSVLFLSQIALSETGPGRVQTTNEVRDLLYPISPLAAFTRGLCRVYLLNEMIGSIRPILAEMLQDESVSVPLSKSLADQTIIASLAVRLWTAAVDVVVFKMPLPFVIAIEEAFRLHVPSIPTGPLVGVFLTSCLVTSCVVFCSDDFHITTTPESLSLLVRVHTAVNEALIASLGQPTSVSSDLAQLIQGIGNDIHNRATPLFHGLVARCTNPVIPKIERVNEPRILERAACVLRQTIKKGVTVKPDLAVQEEGEQTGPFKKLLEDFKARALELKNIKHAIHPFHQYHLHHYSFGTHSNPQGPTLEDTARPPRGAYPRIFAFNTVPIHTSIFTNTTIHTPQQLFPGQVEPRRSDPKRAEAAPARELCNTRYSNCCNGSCRLQLLGESI